MCIMCNSMLSAVGMRLCPVQFPKFQKKIKKIQKCFEKSEKIKESNIFHKKSQIKSKNREKTQTNPTISKNQKIKK